MDNKTLQELENKLKKEKEEIEKQLKTFADKDENLKGDWDTRFPKFDSGSASGNDLESAADEVTEYSTLLPIEHKLELKLQRINDALKKMKTDKYGICEKCKKPIPAERLKISPESKLCMDCKRKK